ncbi:hypothetical protein P8A21_39540 (plasmid) [Streptomyces poriferorum]|uniref:hypothetical protein n=1 Tax=Streptomyces poriferorum TaxID=2798799 RepID=UPI00273F7512|nr:hypothetical protein [Streptomyces sp. Alt1]WLQ53651.1 hypothetical protein P8A21_39540 [Streptomyces sp. Alt1]
MSNPASFRDQSNWGDGYELGIEVGSTDDADLQILLSALWSAAGVRGCFGRKDCEPGEQNEVPCTVASLAEYGHLLGQVRLPTGQLAVCGCTAVRGGDESSDWLDFYVPTGALDKTGTVYWDGLTQFRSAVIDDWLAGIAMETFKQAPFRLGLVGWMVSGGADASTLAHELPEERGMGYLLPHGGVLRYGAANI